MVYGAPEDGPNRPASLDEGDGIAGAVGDGGAGNAGCGGAVGGADRQRAFSPL